MCRYGELRMSDDRIEVRLRVLPELHPIIKELAASEDRTLVSMMNVLFREALKARGLETDRSS